MPNVSQNLKKKNLQKVQPTNVFNVPLIFLPVALRVYAVIWVFCHQNFGTKVVVVVQVTKNISDERVR